MVGRLKAGGLVVFPTDTVTGIGCLASSASGVESLFALKGRERDKPLILFVENMEQAAQLAGGLSPRVMALLTRAWPGPLTAVLPLAGHWPDGVGRDGGAGYRIPDHPVVRELVRAAGEPLATTSANPAGSPPLARPEDAVALWGDRVSMLPGAGGGGTPSTVADLTAWPPRVLRTGALTADTLLAWSREADAGGEQPPKTAS